jgi:CDP-diacylglycerol--glycerol-3-phosphate 3-phosphatidyltransferase
MQGGPVGKTERCALLVIAAATGWYVPVLAFLAIGSVATAGLRLGRIRASLGADPAAAVRADDAAPTERRTDGSGSSTANPGSPASLVMSR